jgi:hypothetical protein
MKLNETKLFIFAALLAGFSVACDDDMGSDDPSSVNVDEEETSTNTGTDSEQDSESQLESDTPSATEDASDEDSDSSWSTDPSTDEEEETLTASDTDTENPLGQFGDPCETSEDCEDGVCHEFGQIGLACTLECENDLECPDGSEGQKCNKQGVCRP